MKMKLIMESFKRSLKENFSDSPVVNTREYTINGVDILEEEHEDGTIAIYEYVEETGELEFRSVHKSRAHWDSVKFTKKLIPMLDGEVEFINQAASFVQGLSASEDEAAQIAAEGVKEEAQERIYSLEQEKKSIEDLFDQYGGRSDEEFGYGEEDELDKAVYVDSGEASKELESIERRIEALKQI